jgi:hypothetical protein
MTRRSFLKLCVTSIVALAIPVFGFPKKALSQEEQSTFPITFSVTIPSRKSKINSMLYMPIIKNQQ